MGLYRRKDSPFWWMAFRMNGRRVYESTGTNKKKLAERIHAKRLTELTEGRWFEKPRPAGTVTFDELGRQYLEWATRQKGYRCKKSVVKKLRSVFGPRLLRGFGVQAVEEFQAALIADGKAAATANRHVETLKHMFTKAVEWELITEEVQGCVRRVKLLPLNNRRLRYLSKEEGRALVDACSPHLKPIVITALNTGMRKSEILGLEWEKHVDLRHGFILLDQTKNGTRREVPINQTLRATLRGLVRRIDCPYVFADADGRRYQDVRRSFHSACRRAGVKDFWFHDLRHTFASQLVMSGVDLTTLKELLGHKSFTMTLRYAHLAPSHRIAAVELLDGYDLVTFKKKGSAGGRQTP